MNQPHVICCPVCQSLLTQEDKRWLCPQQHSFDIARHGYTNLLVAQHKKSKSPGDTQEMVDARLRVLNSEIYQPISNWLNEHVLALLENHESTAQIADIGCGEGYYTSRLADFLNTKEISHQLYGVDISKEALRRAAKRNQSIHWLVASGGLLPFQAHSLDLIACLFTNLMPQGFAKVLKPNAPVILLNTGEDHLLQLREIIYPVVKKNAFNPTSGMQQQGYRLAAEHRLKFDTQLTSAQQILDVLQMTPHRWKTSEQALAKLKTYNELTLCIDISMHIFYLNEE